MNKEKFEEEFRYQMEFVDYLNSLEKISHSKTRLASSLSDKYLYRLETYQSSYLGRITSNLSDTLFQECQNLFGQELVAQVLAGFFKVTPPTETNLIDAPRKLTEYLRNNTSSKESLLFADLAEICIRRWAILIGPDFEASTPSTDTPFSDLYLLRSTELVKPCAHHDLYLCWLSSQSKDAEIPEDIFQQSSGVLLAKTSPTDFIVVAVSSSVLPLVEALNRGLSLEQALDAFTEHESEATSQKTLFDDVQSLITSLAASKILTSSHNNRALSI